MRTTLGTINNKILYNLNRLTEEMNRLNQSISSERQISTPSDNPGNLVAALGLRSSLAEIEQYGKNLTYASSFVDASERALQQMKDAVMRGKVLALNAINSAMNSSNRANMALEVANLFEQVVTLANTQVNGKYIFGGYRTAGYDELEPTPFVIGKADGYRITGRGPGTLATRLTGTVNAAGVAAGDLTINGTAIGAIAASGGATNGLYMDKAAAAVSAINAATSATGVSAGLTTLYAGSAATANTGGDSTVSFDLNGETVEVEISAGATAAQVADAVVSAINAATDRTGVSARVGDGANGGALNAVVFTNAQAGDDSTIAVTNLNPPTASSLIGFSSFSQAADATHNTGEVSLSGTGTFVLASPNASDDTVLAALGLDGGGLGLADEADDGELVYGWRLGEGDLVINGVEVPAATADGYSDVYADASAHALAAAINSVADQTGVSAVIVPALVQGSDAVTGGALDSGDLVINGVDIFDSATTVLSGDEDNALVNAINAKSSSTGVIATRTADGKLLLTPINTPTEEGDGEGRNIHIQLSGQGEAVTGITGGSGPQDKVYFGALQLRSDRRFLLETTATLSDYEPGLAVLGLDGGEAQTGEDGDVGGDGRLAVKSIMTQEGNVRYAGDRDHDIAVKIGKRSTLEISQNGQDAVVATGVFSVLKNMERYLRGEHFTSATGIHQASDITATLDSGDTGLPNEDTLQDGTFTVTVTDFSVYPPRELDFRIAVDTAEDSLVDIAARINGIPGISASWNDGRLTIESADPDRYSFTLTEHSSNFLQVAGITQEDMQIQALTSTVEELDAVMNELNDRIADFGSRANRITVQNQLFDNLELAARENLSEAQDTDLVEALMQFKSRETAYQAALTAAARTLQLSLVNFL